MGDWAGRTTIGHSDSRLPPTHPFVGIYLDTWPSSLHNSGSAAGWPRTFLHIMQAGGPHQEPVCAWLSRAAAGIQCTQVQASPVGQGRRRRVCISWNKGDCIFPEGECSYLHECPSCKVADHRARDCAKVPETSVYKKRRAQLPTSRR